ncbi:hypothetical protein ACJX0J_033334, partial [Zea mays]
FIDIVYQYINFKVNPIILIQIDFYWERQDGTFSAGTLSSFLHLISTSTAYWDLLFKKFIDIVHQYINFKVNPIVFEAYIYRSAQQTGGTYQKHADLFSAGTSHFHVYFCVCSNILKLTHTIM